MRLKEPVAARETRKLEALVQKRAFPPGISTFDIEYGEDPTGDPGVWIWFHHDDEPKMSRMRIRELSEFMQSVQTDIPRSIGAQPFPYVGLRSQRSAKTG